MKSLLANLFPNIVVTLLIEWISEENICTLDTAFCNQKERSFFLNILSRCSIIDSTSNLISIQSHFKWILLRGMKLKVVYLNPYDQTIPLYREIVSKSDHFNYLQTPWQKEHRHYLDNVKSVVTLKAYYTFDFVLSFLKRVSSVEHLDVSECDVCYSTTFLKDLVDVCPTLQSIVVKEMCVRPLFALPTLQHIHGCNISSYFNRPSTTAWYTGDLKRVTSYDSAVISDAANYFQISKLVVTNIYEAEVQFISDYIENLESFTILTVSTPMIAAVVTKCFSLTSIHIRSTDRMDLVYNLVQQSRLLRSLTFDNCTRGSRDIVRALTNHCPLLESLTINGQDIPELEIKLLFQRCPLLDHVNFWRSRQLTEMTVKLLAVNLGALSLKRQADSVINRSEKRGLKRLEVSGNQLPGNFNVKRFFLRNPCVFELEFVNLSRITDTKFCEIVQLCPQMTSVRLTSCSGITSILPLKECHELRSLYLSYQAVKQEDLLSVLEGKCLSRLALPNHDWSVREILTYIGKYSPNIRNLDFSSCQGIGMDDVMEFLLSCSRVDTLLVFFDIDFDRHERIATITKGETVRVFNFYRSLDKEAMRKFITEAGLNSWFRIV